MSKKNINSEDKEVKESDFCKIKKIFTIDETHVDKIAVSKKEPYGTNISLDIMIMMLLDHYV